MEPPRPTPQRIFETLGAFQRTAAMRAAIELDLFSAIGEGANTALLLADQCAASLRGIQKLCDYLTMLGFLVKNGDVYSSASDAAIFLDRRSPAYLGEPACEALAGEPIVAAFAALADAVRLGGTALTDGGTLAPEHPIWVDFARAMAVPGLFLARVLADLLAAPVDRPIKILDIAGGHGLYGIEFARRNPYAEVFAVEWPHVLALASRNAESAGVSDRFHPIPGDALSVDFGGGYDLALITNFLPDLGSTEGLLKRVHSALTKNGRVALFELMLNDNSVSPPAAVALNLTLLATTPRGETRTASQLTEALKRSGFERIEIREVPRAPNRLAIGHRATV
jgi:O-methyltransferase domain/Dimerisation domain